jgi:hypothetical protein
LALATEEVPRFPPAPPRFSTTTGCPTIGDNSAASKREILSFPPPGGKGETIVKVCFGKSARGLISSAWLTPRNAEHTKRLAVNAPKTTFIVFFIK